MNLPSTRDLPSTMNLNDQVPDFSIPTTSGQTFTLSANRGKNVVLYFYPKDSTPGCTTQGQNFRDLYPDFQAANTIVLGISRDSLKSHENFKEKQAFPFELGSDSDEALCQLFDVIKMKKMYGKEVRGIERSTFVINSEGKLAQMWRGLKVPGHVDTVLAFVKTL